jgi:LacI family transcriptional regulator
VVKRSQPPLRSHSEHGRRAIATIHDVARRAGVSVATVSRVLNGKEVVREETLRLVRAAAEELRYVPNVAARSLSSRRSQTVGIVLPEVHGEFFSEIIRGVDLAARQEGYHILVSGSHSDPEEMLEVLAAMHGRVDGLVVMAPDVGVEALHRALPAGLPLVLLNSSDPEWDAITIDNYGGARAMMGHLIGLGHSRIAFLQGPRQNADAAERLRGYRDGLGEGLGVEAVQRWEYAGDFTEESGSRAAARILAARPGPTRPTAIFAANDSMAVGALATLAEAEVAVPGEMSVVGFDDIPIARYVAPPLTTIRVDIADLGRRAFQLLLADLTSSGPAAAPADAADAARARRSDCIPTTLIVRGSSRAPNDTSETRPRSARKPRGPKDGTKQGVDS